MSISAGGKKKTKFQTLAGMPDTHSMAGMPKKGSPGTMEHGLTDYDYMPTIPGKRYGYKTLKGMPDTRQLNGGWGNNHPGKIGLNTKSLLANKRNSFIEDPQDKRKKWQIKISNNDREGFLNEKMMAKSSITATDDGLCLKGEEAGRDPAEGTFYGIKNGARGWYPVGGGGGGSPNGITPMEVVVGVEWDPKQHCLIMKKQRVLVSVDDANLTETVIFYATPLQDELS